ncbi:hypothetical protein [Haloferula sp.]|uniref:hypothetical protein n=1 Tax=Haloferula sp. TaxID=2497595 RepID=UPI003C74C9B2
MIIADFADKVRAFSPVVVFIDDGFAPAKLDLIDAEDWASLRTESAAGSHGWTKLQAEHFPLLKTVMDLKRDAKGLYKAWELYMQEPVEFKLFDPIFRKIRAGREGAVRRLLELIGFLEGELHLTVCRHPDISSAADDIRRSKLVFLDFFLYQQSTTAKAIEDVRAFQDLLSSKIEERGEQYNRFLFLISTQLPAAESIENFRKAATVKAAFFKPVPKDSLSKDWFVEAFGRKLQRYDDLHRLASYLEVFSEQMKLVTENLRTDLEALELHDLAILDHMRLKADGENLGNYVSWLMSEALASRIRASAPMLKASDEMSAVQRPPFHGMLSPNQVLFSWFAEITFGLLGTNVGEIKVQFGDVYSVAGKADIPTAACTLADERGKSADGVLATIERAASEKEIGDPFASAPAAEFPAPEAEPPDPPPKGDPHVSKIQDVADQELVLIIAPACDLQRVKKNYEVLCVRGAIVTQTPNLFDLMDQRNFLGKDKASGRYKHLLQRNVGGKPNYLLVEWYPDNITTIPVTALQSTGYSRLARLNELFSQEIKEDALRQVGRVGVPVDPAFNVGLGATIAYRPKKQPKIQIEISDSETISGLFTSGNANNHPRIIVSEEFIEFFEDLVGKIDPSTDASLTDVSTKFEEGRKGLLEKGGEGFELSSNQCKIGKAGFTIHYMSEFIRMSGDVGFCGVYFYPRGSIKDPEA